MNEMMYRRYSKVLVDETATPFGEEQEGEEGLGGLFGSHSKGDAKTSRTEEPTTGGGDQSSTPTLDKYGTWLNDQAKEGMLDPILGREQELLRVAQILSRKKKNNPILIGEPGVGKTAIVEALAQRIVSNEVSIPLLNKRIVSVDLAGMVAGSMYRGQFEERIKGIISELKANPDIILYIDEIHTLVGSGNSQGGLDAANILKPALSRGEIKVIGATTLEEYRKSIEKDGALERRFQKVMVEAPDAHETLQILRKLRPRYEAHHHVSYSDEALLEAVRLSDRYVTDRFFPDKAIDAMDEAGAYAFISQQKPIDLSRYEEKIAEAAKLKQKAVAESDYELAIKYRDEEKAAKGALAEYKGKLERGELLSEKIVVGVAEVQKVVSMASGVPVESFTKDDLAALSELGVKLKARVKGQDHVVDAVASAIQRNRIGLRDPNKPIGSFLFLGSTGVGKTLLAKRIACELFGSEEAMIRVDMSEFMERHAVSRLVGAPPGYVGYDEGGELTTKVKRRPYSVILFDEIEKAHHDVHNLLLQLLDDGILTDSNGGKVSFKNTIVIMTSNVGTRQLEEFGTGIGYRDTSSTDYSQLSKEVIEKMLKKSFAPEFLNRIDKIVTFNALGKEVLRDIVDIQLGELTERLQGLELEISYSDKARAFLVEKGFDPKLGARPLNRAIAEYVEDMVTQAIIDGDVKAPGNYRIDIEKGKSPSKLQIIPVL
ncbi:ATP-dependent Clp protease ATP-binding subunit [uncultured Porphyromonas sp.]|uniref:ATP-dependent Clp protease ATP-binding subunit n=1 Tax=uncultured Porphyromonas sp. TaxID=159274 RepID=UPI00263A3D15|nr:ATP-dependent Clp protease ATP-binding subunit [uncultured Porphyromonas sp.]